MDETDVRILRQLVQGRATSPLDPSFRKSFAGIAAEVGVDEDTVRNRVKRFHQSGFIGGWRTILNPHIFRGGEVSLWMDVPSPTFKEELVERVRLLHGLVLLALYNGPLLAVILRFHDEKALQKQVALIRKLANAEGVLAKVPFPECRTMLSNVDWDILRALHGDPRRPYTDVAEELTLSSRTVKRRLERMIEQNTLFAFPAINPKALEGSLMASLLVRYRAEEKERIDRIIATELDRHLWHMFHMLPATAGDLTPCAFNVLIQNVAKAHQIVRWARGIPGIVEARVDLFEDIETSFEVFDEELQQRVGQVLATA